jgi:hypothetical protein
METITERLTKYQFFKKNLDRELFNVLKDNFDFDKERLSLKISWYNGFDINKINTLVKYINIRYASHLDDAIKEELDVIFDKIQEGDVLVLVQIQWIVNIGKDPIGTTHYTTTETLKLIDYKIPTDEWNFDKYLNRWVRKDENTDVEYIETFLVNQFGISKESLKNVSIDKKHGQFKEIKIEFNQPKVG